MCGSKTKLFITEIENSQMNVCRDCSKFGKIIAEVKEPEKPKKIREIIEETGPRIEMLQVIVEDYAKRIKQAREKLNLDQKEFAKKINEKQAVIHKIETGSFEPSMSLTRKLEKFLKIKIVEQHEEIHETTAKTKSDSFTIGDFIKIKK